MNIFGSICFDIFIFFFLGLFVPLSFIMLCMLLLVRLAGDVAAYCYGYRIIPEERRVGEPYVFRDSQTGRENSVYYTMLRYRTPDISDEEESYTHLFYRQNPANNNELLVQEQQQDEQLILFVPTCCPRYARVSSQWSWLQLVILPTIVVLSAIPLYVNCSVLFTNCLRAIGMSTFMAHALPLVVYGSTALWAFQRHAVNAYGRNRWWNPCYRRRHQQMRPGSSEPIYSRVTDQPEDDQIALAETAV